MKLALVLIAVLLSSAAFITAQTDVNSVTGDFPLSLWKEHKQVTQIPWSVFVGKAYFRSDFRQELQFGSSIRPIDLQRSGDTHDLFLFARVLDGATPITKVQSLAPNAPTLFPITQSPSRGAYWTQIALVRPGKYKLELALLDRATGRYNTRYEDFTVLGNENDVLEQALQVFPRIEFVEMAKAEDFVRPPRFFRALPVGGISSVPLSGIRTTILSGRDLGVSNGPPPSFVVKSPRKLHLSVVTILSPPDRALENEYSLYLFQNNLTNFLSAFSRFEIVQGAATLTGVDLSDRILVFDRVDLNKVTREMLKNAIDKDSNSVSVDALTGKSESGRFFRDILKARFEQAEKESDGAEHVIIVVSARSKFPKGAGIPPLSPERDCHCRVIYVRFALEANEPDDIVGLLKAYKPRVFDPLDWQEFRKDFATIYEQLVR